MMPPALLQAMGVPSPNAQGPFIMITACDPHEQMIVRLSDILRVVGQERGNTRLYLESEDRYVIIEEDFQSFVKLLKAPTVKEILEQREKEREEYELMRAQHEAGCEQCGGGGSIQ